MHLFSIGDLLKKVRMPTPKREIGGIIESYLSLQGIRSFCSVSSISGQTLYLKTDSATRQYIHMHKDKILAYLNERVPQHHVADIA